MAQIRFTELGLPRPTGIHRTSNIQMAQVVEHLYRIRVATAPQLATLIGTDSRLLRRKLAGYRYVSKHSRPVTMYQDDEWATLSKVNTYTLPRSVVEAYEAANNIDYYTAQPQKQATPESERIERYILMAELYTRLYKAGMIGRGMSWLPNVVFQSMVAEKDRKRSLVRLATINGVDNNGQLIAMSMYGGNAQGVKQHIKHCYDEFAGNFSQCITLTLGGAEVDFVSACSFQHGYVRAVPYEWALKNPVAFLHILQDRIPEFILPFLGMSWSEGTHIEKGSAVFRFCVYDKGSFVSYVDTTIGRPVGFIRDMITEVEKNRNTAYRVFIASEAEKVLFGGKDNVECKVARWG